MSTERFRVVFLPGAILPAAEQYAPLLAVLGDRVSPLLHDLELYATDAPPADYDLSAEVSGLKRAADTAGWDSFHLVGYSGGGAVALAFVGTYPGRVDSLALSEPAVIPSPEWLAQEPEFEAQLAAVMALPPDERMREFVRAHLRPGVLPPTPRPGDPPSWMAKRPAGMKVLARALWSAEIGFDQLRRFRNPAYLAIGSLSNAIEERKAETLARLFPGLEVEMYEGRHHFDPPQRAEPERFAAALLRLWARGKVSGA
jgi:pimeloyl-ACP methyl ester carboxylesterase